MNQIKAGVNQGAIEIEHQQADAMRIKLAQETNHGKIRINQVSVLSSQFSVLRKGWPHHGKIRINQVSGLRSQFSVLSSQFSVLRKGWPPY